MKLHFSCPLLSPSLSTYEIFLQIQFAFFFSYKVNIVFVFFFLVLIAPYIFLVLLLLEEPLTKDIYTQSCKYREYRVVLNLLVIINGITSLLPIAVALNRYMFSNLIF